MHSESQFDPLTLVTAEAVCVLGAMLDASTDRTKEVAIKLDVPVSLREASFTSVATSVNQLLVARRVMAIATVESHSTEAAPYIRVVVRR